MQPAAKNILALDIGARRVGVALAGDLARLPQPLTTLYRSDSFFDELKRIVTDEAVGLVVVGLPRGLNGQATEQTATVEHFGRQIAEQLKLPIVWQDEALTSVKAKTELNHRQRHWNKTDVDSLAATYILEDYLREHPGAHHG